MFRAQPVDDLLPGQSFNQADCSGSQNRMNTVPADQRHPQVNGFTAVMQAQANTFQTKPFDIIRPQVCLGVKP